MSNSNGMSPVSAIVARVARFLSEASRSRLAWLIVFLHAAWFLLAIANMSPPSRGLANYLEHGGWSSATIFAGRPFHFRYESLALKILTLLDLPSSLVSTPFAILFFPFSKLLHLGLYEGSYAGACILLAVSSLQWLAIGYRADKWLAARQGGSTLLRLIHRSFTVVTILIFLLTAISAPILNARSRRLGSRHGGISFH